MEIRKIFLEYIETHNCTSFTELERCMEEKGIDYKDNFCWHLNGYPNLILWTGWKLEIFNILNDLLRENKIEIKHDNSTQVCYLIDGKLLSFPIAKQIRHYKEEHWIPITFSKGA